VAEISVTSVGEAVPRPASGMNYKSVALLVLAHTATDINQGAVPVLLPFLIAQNHLSYAAAATIVFAVNCASTVSQPGFGWLADRLSRPWMILAGLMLAGIGLSLMGIVPTYRLLLAAGVVCGLGVSAFHPEGARVMNRVGGDKKATAMSFFAIGGQLGFAIGPLVATAALIRWGMKGTLAFLVPVVVIAALTSHQLFRFTLEPKTDGDKTSPAAPLKDMRDAWGPFFRLSAGVVFRSTIFYGLNTFLPLFWINVLHQSKAVAGTRLSMMFGFGVVGSILGGRAADRFGYRTVIAIGFRVLALLLPCLLLVRDPLVGTILLLPVGFTMFSTIGPMIVLGQKYLPTRIGFASGVTLGLAFSFGGLVTPVLGLAADRWGVFTTIAILAALPIICVALALTYPVPEQVTKA
jgi:FSR family fosmidomycin resistance protein-like MFS transporter